MAPKKKKEDIEQGNLVAEPVEPPEVSFVERTKDLHKHIQALPGGIRSLYERVKKRIEEENAKLPEDKKIKMMAEKTFYRKLSELTAPGKTIYDNLNLLIFICEESNYPINSLLTGKVLSSFEREQESYKKGFNDGIAYEKAEQRLSLKAQKAEQIPESYLENLNYKIIKYSDIISECKRLHIIQPTPLDAFDSLFGYSRNEPKVFGHGKSIPELKKIDSIIEFILTNQFFASQKYYFPINFNHNNIRNLLIAAYLYMAIDGFVSICSNSKQWKSKGPRWMNKLMVTFSITADSPEQEKELYEHLSGIGRNLGWLCKKENLETIAYTTSEATQKYMPSIDSFVDDCIIFSQSLRTYSKPKKSEYIKLRKYLGLPNDILYSNTMAIDDNLLTLAKNMDNKLQEARGIIKELEQDCTAFQQMKEETVSLLSDMRTMRFTVDNEIEALVDTVKTVGKELASVARFTGSFNILTPYYCSSTNIDDYTKLAYDSGESSFNLLDKKYLVKWDKNSNAYHILTGNIEFWFDTAFRQAKKDGVLVWFNENFDVVHAKTEDGLEVWFGPGYYARIRWKTGQEDTYFNSKLLSAQIKPDGSKRFFDYSDGILSSVTDPDNNKWEFIYDLDGKLVKVLEPDKTAINNPEKALPPLEQPDKQEATKAEEQQPVPPETDTSKPEAADKSKEAAEVQEEILPSQQNPEPIEEQKDSSDAQSAPDTQDAPQESPKQPEQESINQDIEPVVEPAPEPEQEAPVTQDQEPATVEQEPPAPLQDISTETDIPLPQEDESEEALPVALPKELEGIPLKLDEEAESFVKDAADIAAKLRHAAVNVVPQKKKLKPDVLTTNCMSCKKAFSDGPSKCPICGKITLNHNKISINEDLSSPENSGREDIVVVKTELGKKFWFKDTLCQAKMNGVLVWYNDLSTVARARRDDGMEIWVTNLGAISHIKRPSGIEYWYDGSNRLIKQVNPDGTERRFSYSSDGKSMEITDPDGSKHKYTMP